MKIDLFSRSIYVEIKKWTTDKILKSNEALLIKATLKDILGHFHHAALLLKLPESLLGERYMAGPYLIHLFSNIKSRGA